MSRIEERFQSLAGAGRAALLPFLTAGFPDTGTTEALIRRADEVGVAAMEIGFPYSDSIADGPVIQESFNHVLSRGGGRVAEMLEMVSRVRGDVSCALIAMISYSIVHRFGKDRFITQAVSAGIDGVIIPDLPVEEADDAGAAIKSAGLCHIGLVAPTTSPARRGIIARASSGFIYMIATSGTTGERKELATTLPSDVALLKQESGMPVCVGFGISSAEHVRRVSAFADGAIVGSAIVRRIAECIKRSDDGSALVNSVGAFVAELMQGTDPTLS